jgi:hypothetical protein
LECFKVKKIGNKIFYLVSDEQNEEVKYFQIKMKKFNRNNEELSMLQFVNISGNILYDIEKAQN